MIDHDVGVNLSLSFGLCPKIFEEKSRLREDCIGLWSFSHEREYIDFD